jgi:hypothetical protein
MVKKLLPLLFTYVLFLAFPLAAPGFAQEAPAKAEAAKEARWEGRQLDPMGQPGARQQKSQ